jgi:hypothetical protein
MVGIGRYPRHVNRRCNRVGCQAAPVSTLTYNYARSTATLGPLAPEDDPNGYDLCVSHARRLQVPTGWRLERLSEPPRAAARSAAATDPAWLVNLADEVRRIGWGEDAPPAAIAEPVGGVELARRGHLRVIAGGA